MSDTVTTVWGEIQGQEITFTRMSGVETVTFDGGDVVAVPLPFRGLLAGDEDVFVEARRADEKTWVLRRSPL